MHGPRRSPGGERWNRTDFGFALVACLSLMVLLVVIAVGLLALSAVSLRSSAREEAMAAARSNAKLSLMIALGELQRGVGPDQRITAPASLVNPEGSPAVTGVWQTWVPDGNATDYTVRKETTAAADADPSAADGHFVAWLASGGDPSTPAGSADPPGSGVEDDTVPLMSDRSGPEGVVRGVHLERTAVGQDGGFAWTAIDEGLKARFDLPFEPETSDETREARLRAPGRPQPEVLATRLETLRADDRIAPKLVSLAQGGLHADDPDLLRGYAHDFTPHAVSLFTNVAQGGLKADLSRAFEGTLPAELANRHLYSHESKPLLPADPSFRILAEHYRLHRQNPENLRVRVPNRYQPSAGNRINLNPPDGGIVAPVITRISVVFSLVSRTAHGGWINTITSAMQDNQMRQMVYLIYTPVVTVYNPYSVPLEFDNLKVTFKNLPVGFKFFRNGEPLQNRHTLLSTFHISSQNRENWDDPFGLTAANQPGSSSSTSVVLSPGEARVFGVAHDIDTTWDQMNNYLWQNDLAATKTNNVFAGSGWDYRSGYIVDWLVPNISDPTAAGRRRDNNESMGVFAVAPNDRINVEVAPRMPGGSNGRFKVEIETQTRSRPTPLGAYSFIYHDERTLERILRDPDATGDRHEPFPFRIERDLPVGPNHANSIFMAGGLNTPLREWGSAPRPFAIFSLTARTANDSLYPGKPGITSSFVHNVLEMDVRTSHPALLPMEMQLLPITGSGANVTGSIEADEMDRAFYFSGLNRGSGAISHVSCDIPRSQLVNLADLRHANIANSGYLPLTQMTIGESLASPFVPPDRVTATNTGFGYDVPDHAWHANNNIWDHYFFSGIRDSNDATLLFDQSRLPLNPRLAPLPPTGLSTAEAITRSTAEDAWTRVASMVALRGGFNVNSTSVVAWKALLSSLHEAEVPVLGPVEINVSPIGANQQVITSKGTALPRQSRPIAGPLTPANHQDNTVRWSGFRDLDEAQIDRLAREIVNEIRTRGPFLSMAEFVNRRVGRGETAEAGALESAIRRAGINDEILPVGGLRLTEDQASAYGYANPAAAAGSVEEGAAGVLRQGDLLSMIGAQITVRSDTFVIRGYGEARKGSQVTARAWCEAVIQRLPEFVDPADPPERVQPTSGRGIETLGPVNRRFGRRLEIVSFKWLHPGEI